MADSSTTSGPDGVTRIPARCRFGPALIVVVALVPACGRATSPTIGNEAVATTVALTTTTTTTASSTTTIDFGREPDQERTPLPAEAGRAEVAELLDDMRGPTESVGDQMRRLVGFPLVAGPAGSQILDLAVSAEPPEEERRPARARVVFRAPQDGRTVATSLSNELRARGWNKADESRERSGEVTTIEMVFRVPGRSGDEVELLAVVEGRPGVTTVDLDYRTMSAPETPVGDPEGPPVIDRLVAWTDGMPLPASANLIEAGLSTAGDLGALQSRYRVSAASEAEAIEAVVARVDASDYELAGVAGDQPPVAGPLELADGDGRAVVLRFTPTADPEVMELSAVAEFGLTPVD